MHDGTPSVETQQSDRRAGGTGRSGSLGRLFDDRGLRLGAALAVVVAIPVSVLFYFQFRSIDDLASTSSVVLRQLSQETVDAAAADVEDALKRPHIGVLLAVPQARTDAMDLPAMDAEFRQGLDESPFVEAFYVWSSVARERAGTMFVYNRDSLADVSGDLDLRFRNAPGVAAMVLPRLQQLLVHKRAIVAFPATIGGRKKYVQAQLRFANPDRLKIASFIALVVDANDLRQQHLPALMKARLATVQHLGGFPQLDLTCATRPAGCSSRRRRRAPRPSSTSAAFRWSSSTASCSSTPRPSRSSPRPGPCRPGSPTAPSPRSPSRSSRPQLVLMSILALVMAAGVLFVAGAAAREVRVAELKSNFVASVSHDLKTPLALIQLFAETLELGRVRTPERAAEYYRIINDEAKKLTRLIENILDFSRMEAGLRPYRTAPADLGDVTRDVVRRMHSQIEQGRFTVTTSVEPGLPAVDLDAGAVQQAIENVLANAMKYSRERRDIALTVTRHGSSVHVAVSDHGIGIDRRNQRRIFRKFYRVDSGLGGGPQGPGSAWRSSSTPCAATAAP